MFAFDDLLSVISFNVVSRVRPRKVLGMTNKAVFANSFTNAEDDRNKAVNLGRALARTGCCYFDTGHQFEVLSPQP